MIWGVENNRGLCSFAGIDRQQGDEIMAILEVQYRYTDC